MRKLERLKSVKILQNGKEVDAYINIAEDIKAKAYGETRETVNMTVYAEFFNENHETLEGIQIVKEYEGERDIDEIVWKINEDRLNDEEIMRYEDEKYEELQRNLPLMYKELDKMIDKEKQMGKERTLWLISPLKVNDIIDEARTFFFYEDNGLYVMYLKRDYEKQEKFLIKVETINDEMFETLEEVLKAYPYAGHTTKEKGEKYNPEGMWHRAPKSVKHPWKTKWKNIWKKLKFFKTDNK